MEKKIIIVAGEPSGDLQAGLLVSAIKELDNKMEIFAVGGESLKKAGARIIYDIKDLSVLGLFDVLRKLGKFKELMRLVLNKIDEIRPAAIIFVDFSGFNLRLAKKINPVRNYSATSGRQEVSNGVNKRIKTIYYISPQVWASRPGRIKTIKKFIDKVYVIFKFEQGFYKKFGIEAEFIGHPLLDIVKPSLTKEETLIKFGLKENTPIFALLPGSRASEIKNILPIMLESAKLLREKLPLAQFIISKPSSLDNTLYEKIINLSLRGLRGEAEAGRSNLNLEIKIIESMQYDCLNVADFVLVASGTATLEAAIMQKPNLVIYKMGILNYLLYRPLVKVPFIGMENIVAGKLIAPEFIQFKAKPKIIAKKVLEMFEDKKLLEELKKDFTGLREKLGNTQAPLCAAKSMLAFINSRNNG